MDKLNSLLGGDSSRKKASSYFEKEKRDIDFCEICHKPFKQLVQRKHKCKRCKRYICSQCGQSKTIIIGIDMEKNIPHRTCDLCIFDQFFIREFIEIHQIKWNHSSLIGEKWVKLIDKENCTLSYQQCKTYFEKNAADYEDDYEIILKDIDDGRTDYELWNYSMRDFLYELQKDIPKEKIKLTTKNVLKALIIKFPEIGYCQGMNYILTFFLCFCNEEQSFNLFTHLVQNILPSKFFQGNEKGDGLLGVMAEKHVLSFFVKDFLDPSDLDKIDLAQQILELKSAQWLLCLLVNILDLKSTYFIWDNTFNEKSFVDVDKSVLLIISNQIKNLCDPNYDSALINDSIVRNISLDLLKKNSRIPLDEKLKKKYFEEYIKGVSDKWNKKEPFVFRQLERITHFSKDEIKEIQNEFLRYLDEKTKKKKESNQLSGINKEDFIEIMNSIQENKNLQGKAFLKLSPTDLDRIFEIFDDNKTGSLDFREFLCCISLLIRGQIKEKMDLCFYLFDRGHKNYLDSTETDNFLETLMKAISISFTKDSAEFYTEKFQEFKKRILSEFCSNNRMNFTDLVEITKDPFILEISNHYRGLIRKGTSAQVAATINHKISDFDCEKK